MRHISASKYLFIAGAFIFGGFLISAIITKSAPSSYDHFAQCLTEKGVKMYGAYWCPHCQNQKEVFGNAFRYVTYEECATPGQPDVMTQACKDAEVEGYPTWKNAAGEIRTGEQSLEELATFSGCAL